MTMDNIDYSDSNDAERQFDIYWPQGARNNTPLICFIHGGAWRMEDKRDHAQLASNLVIATGCPVAVPNYRLTPPDNADPKLRHPIHAEDILQFLNFIIHWSHPSAPFDPAYLILLGHSCSAHMLASIFLNSDSVSPSLAPTQALIASVKGIVLSEGIYDLDTLLARFPAYRGWFIDPAFGPSESYHQFSALHYLLRPSSTISWLLLHSSGDTLVDLSQTEAMHTHLLDISSNRVSLNTTDLTDDHDAIFGSDIYVKIIRDFTASLLS